MRHMIALMLSAVLVTVMGVSALASRLPRFTPEQMRDKTFVEKTIEKYARQQTTLEKQLNSAGELQKLSLETRLADIHTILEALRYVEKNGYNPHDPKLRALPYFATLSAHSLPVTDKAARAAEADNSPEVHDLSEKGVVPPVAEGQHVVSVPPDMVGKGLKGVIKVRCVINEEGVPTAVQIVEGLSPDLDTFTTSTIQDNWRFKPATLNGKPIKVFYNIAIPFDLPAAQAPAKEAPAEKK